MGSAGEKPEHFLRLLGGVGLTQHPAVAHHNGVRSDDHILGLCGDGSGLMKTYPGNLLPGVPGQIHGFINVRRTHGEGNIQMFHQLPTSGRLGR